MTTKLLGGDYAVDRNGRIISLSGTEELIERAMLCLRLKKGSFCHDKRLGSELFDVDLNSCDESLLYAIVSDALSMVHEVKVASVKKRNAENGTLILDISLIIGENVHLLSLSV